MPLYEYECAACGGRFEVIQKFSDPPADACPSCGKGPVERVPSSPAIQFKGTGWYITDYANKGKTDGSAAAGKTESKAESGKAESSSAEGKTGSSTKSESSPAPASTPATTSKD